MTFNISFTAPFKVVADETSNGQISTVETIKSSSIYEVIEQINNDLNLKSKEFNRRVITSMPIQYVKK